MSDPALVVRDLHAGYDEVPVLRGVSLHGGADEIVAVIGPNGAGKSTFLKAVAGIVRPTSGSVAFGGDDVTGARPDRLTRRGLGFVPQLDNVFPTLTVAENLDVGAQALARRDRHDAVAAVVEQFPLLRERRRAKAGDLSGGQQKMVEFAKAYLQRPRLCLIDEPGIGLAPKVAEEVYQWIGLFAAEKMAILLVDHNVRRVVKMSSYIYVLSLGEITAKGKPEDFAGDLHDQVKSWLGINF